MKAVFDEEAADNDVYPIGGSLYTVLFSPAEMPSSPLTEWSFYEGQDRIKGPDEENMKDWTAPNAVETASKEG